MTEHSFRNQVLRGCSGCSTLLQQQEAHLNGQREKPCDHLTAVGEGGGQKEGEQRVALEVLQWLLQQGWGSPITTVLRDPHLVV